MAVRPTRQLASIHAKLMALEKRLPASRLRDLIEVAKDSVSDAFREAGRPGRRDGRSKPVKP